MRKIVPRRNWRDQSHIWSRAPDPRRRSSSCPHPFLNRRPMTSDASIELTGERPARNRQSHGSSGDCRAPVAHSVGPRCNSRRLTEPGRRRRYQNPLFRVATSLCDVTHFFPMATRLPCGRLARDVRLTCTANSNPKENDHEDLKGASDALTQRRSGIAGAGEKEAAGKQGTAPGAGDVPARRCKRPQL